MNRPYEQTPSNPWYMNIAMPSYTKDAYSTEKQNLYLDPFMSMHFDKVDQADRLLNHTAKALVTRTTLERTHTSERQEEMLKIGDHLAQFSDEPFGVNQSRDKMKWGMEQSLMALTREDRNAQLAFWNDIWTMSREFLTCMDSHEKLNRRKTLLSPTAYTLQSRVP